MEWTQTEKATEKQVAETAPAPQPQQGGKKGKSVHISELSIQQLQNIGRKSLKIIIFSDSVVFPDLLNFRASFDLRWLSC